MRIAIGGISHETNTFCRGTTPVSVFQASEWLHGDAIVRTHTGVRSYLGGVLAAATEAGIEVVPTFAASTQPSATIARDAFERMRAELLDGLRQVQAGGPLDAVCLALHGAGVAEGADDLEGAVLQAVRELVGPSGPIVATLDLHANMTDAMVAYADALLGVNEYPHRDAYERGVEALRLAARIARGEVRPVMHLARLPMLLPAATTDEGPAHEVNRLCAAWEARPGLLDCTFFHGFPYCDIPDVGVAVLATADGDPELARAAAEDVASRIWAMREAFRHEPTPPDAAIRLALATAGRPVVINEKSDNPGGGAPGDGTHLLRAMLEAGLTDACFGYIVDPETAAAAHAAGVGVELDVRLGGKTYELHGAPIEALAYVKCLTDGRFRRTSPMGRGAAVDLGPMARLQLPTRGGVVDVIVGSRRQQTLDPELFLLHGIDVTRYKIVALKSSQHFRAGFADLAARIIRADTPGMTGTDYAIFPYRRIRRPIWPLDPDATPAAAAGEGRGG